MKFINNEDKHILSECSQLIHHITSKYHTNFVEAVNMDFVKIDGQVQVHFSVKAD